MRLNEEQQKAVKTKANNVILLAAAGSGKTTVIVERIRQLVKSGCDPNDILVISFTNESTQMMKKRLNNEKVYVNTFHGYCYQLLDKPKISDEKQLNYTEDQLLKFSLYKTKTINKKPLLFNKYQKYLKDNDLLDFDDLIIKAFEKVKNHTFKFVFVDEFQDTNNIQLTLLKMMKKNKVSFFVVGDPDQSIYAFRGANRNIFKDFKKEFNAEVLTLLTNYRSTTKIIKLANRLIGNEKERIEKNIIPSTTKNGIIKVFSNNYNEKEVIDFITSKRTLFQEVAILYRFHHQGIFIKKYLANTLTNNIYPMTLHEAKGLEFDVVIILKLECMPVLITNQKRIIDDERRLLFVGITRAKKELYIFSQPKAYFLKELSTV